MSQKDRGPGVKIPPPVIYLFFALVGYGIESVRPAGLFGLSEVPFLAYALILAGLLIAITAALHFWRAKTHIEPWQPASQLITCGIFSYSRNPIYLAFILVTLGAGLLLNSLWITLSVIPATLCLYQWVIRKEEHYLEQRFGDTYLQYKQSVRRWF